MAHKWIPSLAESGLNASSNKIRDLFKVKLYTIRSETKKRERERKKSEESERERKKREREKKKWEREKKKRENELDFKYLLTLILTGGS